MAQTSAFSRSYRSSAGVDIHATFHGRLIGTLQGISYTITREKAPNYVMGKPDPISFSRGKRGIAGSMIFLVFDRTNLVRELTEFDPNFKFYADPWDIRRPGLDRAGGVNGFVTASDAESIRIGLQGNDAVLSRNIIGEDPEMAIRPEYPWYHDQMPPFDVVLTSGNEHGQISRMVIHNVEILNCGSGISIDDITIDENMTFVCTDITPWYQIRPGRTLDNGIQPVRSAG